MDKEKLAKLQAAGRIGGKGTPRRKQVKKSTTAQQGDDRKIQAALKKLNVQPITGVEEVNMFKEGEVLHFNAPKVHSALPSNTLAITGTPQTKDLTELVPGILNQLGPDSLAQLRKLAENYQIKTLQNAALRGGLSSGKGKEGDEGAADVEGEEEIPQLEENFDDVEEKESGNKLEELS